MNNIHDNSDNDFDVHIDNNLKIIILIISTIIMTMIIIIPPFGPFLLFGELGYSYVRNISSAKPDKKCSIGSRTCINN